MSNYQQFIKNDKDGPSSSPDFFNPLKNCNVVDFQAKNDEENKIDDQV